MKPVQFVINDCQVRKELSHWKIIAIYFQQILTLHAFKYKIINVCCVLTVGPNEDTDVHLLKQRQASASVWLWRLCSCVAARRLLLVYESQQEKCDVVWAPVACVRGHRRPVAALHEALSELEVDPPLQLHWKTEEMHQHALRKLDPFVQWQLY